MLLFVKPVRVILFNKAVKVVFAIGVVSVIVNFEELARLLTHAVVAKFVELSVTGGCIFVILAIFTLLVEDVIL